MPSSWDNIWTNSRYGKVSQRRRRAIRRHRIFSAKTSIPKQLGQVLDLGCGSGFSLHGWIATDAETGTIVLVDESLAALRMARNMTFGSNMAAHVIQADAARLPFEDSFFDTIVSFGCLEHVREFILALEEVARVARQGANIYLTVSSTFSMLYPMRLLRQALRLYPYGFQRNTDPGSLVRTVSNHFEVCGHWVVHTDWDIPHWAFVDRIIGALWPGWGRYIFVHARKK